MANKEAGATGQTEEWEDHDSTPSYNQWHNWYYSQYPYHVFEPLPSTSASPPPPSVPPNWFDSRSKLTPHPRSNDHASERPEKENCDHNLADTVTETVSLKSGHYLELLIIL